MELPGAVMDFVVADGIVGVRSWTGGTKFPRTAQRIVDLRRLSKERFEEAELAERRGDHEFAGEMLEQALEFDSKANALDAKPDRRPH